MGPLRVHRRIIRLGGRPVTEAPGVFFGTRVLGSIRAPGASFYLIQVVFNFSLISASDKLVIALARMAAINT